MLSDRQWAIDWFWKLGLNAPSGAQCFLTKDEEATHVLLYGLNAPSGAQCFPTRGRLWNEAMTVLGMSQCTFWCSVLSDCVGGWACSSGEAGSQCTFWCSVLSDLGQYGPFVRSVVESQCTFWCSVLSDRSVEQGEDGGGAVSMHLLVLSAFRHECNHRR